MTTTSNLKPSVRKSAVWGLAHDLTYAWYGNDHQALEMACRIAKNVLFDSDGETVGGYELVRIVEATCLRAEALEPPTGWEPRLADQYRQTGACHLLASRFGYTSPTTATWTE
jgi:hypothetical protein